MHMPLKQIGCIIIAMTAFTSLAGTSSVWPEGRTDQWRGYLQITFNKDWPTVKGHLVTSGNQP